MMKIEIQGASAVCVQPQLLTVGMVGATVEFSFDEAWDDLTRCAVFTDGMVAKDVLLSGNICVIPHEVLTTSSRVLCVGVYGTNAEGDVVIPTVYAEVGIIRPGADPGGDESYPPAPDVVAQLQAMACAAVRSVNGVTPDENGNVNVSDWGGSSDSSVELDTTLSISGKAADAKAVGDALANVTVSGSGWTTAQINLLDSLFSAIPWTTGTAGASADSLIASLRSTSSGGGTGGGTGGEDEPEAGESDNITQSGNTLIITSLATAPTQSGSVLTIA